MLKEFTIENCILGGTCFILIFTLGCYLWFQNQMAYLQPVDTDPRVEIQHMEKPSETEKVEIPQIDLTDTEQPDTPDKNSDDSETISNFSSAQQHT
ncbi:hypothetical protein J4G08_12935 [Candidatus Poribacteria bacterium]|nr:hypothetical protein [Candidatus Poribacteria bacterium]